MKRPGTDGRAIGGVTLGTLPDMTRAQLFDTWARIVGKPVIRGASRELLLTTIAWHLQAQQHGGLTPAVQRKLERLAAAIDRGEPVRPLTAIARLRPNMSLERGWRGETHNVTVLADGFAYPGLDPVPEPGIDNGLMLACVRRVLVDDFASVETIL